MHEMHLRHSGFMYLCAFGPFKKTKKENKNINKQEIHDIFIKTNQIKHVFNMIWLMEILNI